MLYLKTDIKSNIANKRRDKKFILVLPGVCFIRMDMCDWWIIGAHVSKQSSGYVCNITVNNSEIILKKKKR